MVQTNCCVGANTSLYVYIYMHLYITGVMEMGNSASRKGIEPTSLAFRASVQTIVPTRPTNVANNPCCTFPERSVQIHIYLHIYVSADTYIYIYIYICM